MTAWKPGTEPSREKSQVVDPTSVLLRQISGVESRVPWIPLGIALLTLLWIPVFARLGSAPVRPAESAWVQEALNPGPDSRSASAFSRQLTLATWEWQGADITSAELTPPQRLAARIPSFAAGLAALLVFFFLARLVVGDAAALLAACLLTTAVPWARAGTSVLPLIVGELFVLFGVLWALTLQSRHREVGVAPVNAVRIGGAGVFLGIGLLLAPAAVATFATTLLLWLLLGLRRSSSKTTTLPGRPREITFFAVAGTAGLLLGAAVSMWAVERFLGGAAGGFPRFVPQLATLDLWEDVYRQLLSPGPWSDRLILAAAGVIALVRAVEWSAGRPWQAAGLLPWAFLGLWVMAVRADTVLSSSLGVPLTVPPLFILGGGWLVLRGLRPGVIRRQEYTFLVVWVLMGSLLVPFVGGELRGAQLLAASVVLLPPLMLAAGRGARALWEAEESPLARISVLVVAYVPVAASLLVAVHHVVPNGIPVIGRAGDSLQTMLPWIVLTAVALGALSVLITVRPDPAPTSVIATGREGGRSGRGRQGGRRGRGSGGGRSSSGGRGSGGGRSSGSGARSSSGGGRGSGSRGSGSGRSSGGRSSGGSRRGGRRRGNAGR